MKKIFAIFFALGISTTAYAMDNSIEGTYEQKEAILFIDGEVFDHDIIIKEDRSLVPMRFITEELGATVGWNNDTKVATIVKNDNIIRLEIGDYKAIVNGDEVELDYPTILYNDLTYVPLRFIAENFNADIHYSQPWVDDYSIIKSNPNIMIDQILLEKDYISIDEAMNMIKQTCLIGLENFIISTTQSLEEAEEDVTRFDNHFDYIRQDINNISFVGEVSKYYKFNLSPGYDILFDKDTHEMYFTIYSQETIVKKIDVDDKSLYTLIYIVG
ncbi:MAG: hypothetical protein BEN19_08180 [Epulopiscium sp. Nuni2H_MBin003]|nr:MAG: hypothetical protein BEN19_08180 [Epulopiscium sp. Nuni2H_MBin003]